jgi:ubiquinone biosynthesis UbiH/UbiF/VisC/COQ6 family hydroxylase
MGMEFDVAIVGAGLVGLSLARALAGSGLSLALVDRAPAWHEEPHAEPDSWDVRVFAISPGSESFLAQHGAWPDAAPERIAAVLEMQVFGDAPGSRIVFGAYEAHVARLASIVENRMLLAALWRGLRAQPEVKVFAPTHCESAGLGEDSAHLTLADGTRVQAHLLVAADGQDSWLRAQAGIETRVQPYRQAAVVANFACELPHGGTAFQWFRSDGVLALLPLPGNRASLVWSAEEALAEQLMAEPDALGTKVAEATARRLGALETITPPAAFPLRLARVARLVQPRLALVGDAAHNLHPLAGQGVNLGFQDARELASVLQSRGACADVGELRLLRRYERARREDVLAMTLVTDGLKRLFNNSFPPLAWLRNHGLDLVDRASPLKGRLMRHALD